MPLKVTNVDQNVYEMAKERIRYAYSLFDHIAVSFSGGKDSTMVVNLAIEVATELNRLPVHVIFWDEEAIPYETERYVRRVAERPEVKLDWYCVPIEHNNGCSSLTDTWITWNPAERDKWVRDVPPEGLTAMPNYHPDQHGAWSIPGMNNCPFPPEQYGNVGLLLGIRADESIVRRRSVMNREHENYIVKAATGDSFGALKVGWGNLYKVMPIYDWSTEDVWTACAELGWDYNEAYDLYEMLGLNHNDQRVAPPYGVQPGRNLWMWRECFPDVWDKVSRRVPGANTRALYGTGGLYGLGKVEKPEGVDWPDWIKQLLSEIDDPKKQLTLAKYVRSLIKRHHKKANGLPLLPYHGHPDCMATWERIAKIVIRKEDKGRLDPAGQRPTPNSDKWHSTMERYLAGVEAWRNGVYDSWVEELK